MQLRCPQCGKRFDREQTDAMPFCCKRCRLIDLGGWLNEEHSVPHERELDEYGEYEEPPGFSEN